MLLLECWAKASSSSSSMAPSSSGGPGEVGWVSSMTTEEPDSIRNRRGGTGADPGLLPWRRTVGGGCEVLPPVLPFEGVTLGRRSDKVRRSPSDTLRCK